MSDIGGKIRIETHHPFLERLGAANERHTLGGETAKIDRVSTVRTAHRDRDVFCTRIRGGGIPLAENPQPPDEIATTVASRRSVVRANRQVHLSVGQ